MRYIILPAYPTTVRPVYNEQVCEAKSSLKVCFRYYRSIYKEIYAMDANVIKGNELCPSEL